MGMKEVMKTLDAVDSLTIKFDVEELSSVDNLLECLGHCYKISGKHWDKVTEGSLYLEYDDEEYEYYFVFVALNDDGTVRDETILTTTQVLQSVFKTESAVKEFQKIINANT